MYSARTLLVPVLLMGGLMEVASAQHKYIFPQLKLPTFVDSLRLSNQATSECLDS